MPNRYKKDDNIAINVLTFVSQTSIIAVQIELREKIMKLMLGLLGGFFVMGSVGSLETNVMTVTETLIYSVSGFALCGYSLSDLEIV
jgi:ethanolamine utilization microcompartment shell protein EutS